MDPEQQLSPREEAAPSRCRKCRQWVCGNRLLFAGIVLTAIYITGIAVYFCAKWSSLGALAPNETGDMLAGMFGPLAFAWLVLGYFQQGQELRQNNEALRLQAQELQHSVEQQKRLVEENRKQLELQKNEFEYAVENDKTYKEEQRQARQPLFSLKKSYGIDLLRPVVELNEKIPSCVVTLKTQKAMCHGVKIFFHEKNSGEAKEIENYPAAVHPGEDVTITLPFDDRGEPREMSYFLEIQYFDALGYEERQFFEIKIKANKSYIAALGKEATTDWYLTLHPWQAKPPELPT